MTRWNLRLLYWSIEINLILWMAVFGLMAAPKGDDIWLADKVAIVGFMFSALLQHWAYYNVRRAYLNQTTRARPA
jgi:hypothetical protein